MAVVQCDLVSPRCANCRKRAIKCQFENHGQELCTNPGIASLSVSSTSTTSSVHGKDFELFHHFFNITSSSIASTLDQQYVWRYVIPSLAQEHDYLWHSLLALSAVHNAHLRPFDQQRYQRLAVDYQSRAATRFQAVRTITRDNSYAICASAGIVILVEWGQILYFDSAGHTGLDPIQELLEKLILVRKVTPLWTSAQAYLEEESVPQVQFPLGEYSAADLLPDKIDLALRNLELLQNLIPRSSRERTTYTVAIKVLSWSTKDLLVQPRSLGQPLYWSTAIDDHFIHLLKLKEPLALVVLAHYCNLLYHASTQWCLAGSAKTVFRAIKESVGDSWSPLLDCVEESMKIDPHLRPGIVYGSTAEPVTINSEQVTAGNTDLHIGRGLFEDNQPPVPTERVGNAPCDAYHKQAPLARLTGALLGVNPWN